MTSPDWKAPAQDGQILLAPSLAELGDRARDNHRRLSNCTIDIAGQPLSVWRQRLRETLSHPNPDQLLICTGHQAELYHPGVWIKLAVIDRLAKSTGGRALQISVDSDAPKHLQLRYPNGAIDLFSPEHQSPAWTGRLGTPSASLIQEARSKIASIQHEWEFCSLLPEFLRIFSSQSAHQSHAAIVLANSMQELDRQFSLSYSIAMSQPIWQSDSYYAFLSHLFHHAEQFAECYNAALAQYRRVEHIKTPGRPMPDLSYNDHQFEMPFWLDNLQTGQRQRLALTKHAPGLRLQLSNEFLDLPATPESLASFCSALNFRIAPRALTLTMFLRLFAADQWIHGIGGARYDQVTDQIIRDFFRIDPPSFGVCTATLFFPTSTTRQRIDLSALKHAGHHLRHGVLGDKKKNYLHEIAAAPRKSAARSDIFLRMHQAMGQAHSRDLDDWNTRWRDAQSAAAMDRPIFDRELFYAIQPPERLLMLCQQIV